MSPNRQPTPQYSLPPTPTKQKGDSHGLPDLGAFIDGDERPTFISPINLLGPVRFEILLSNKAFSDDLCSIQIHQNDDASLRFRSWAQSVKHWRKHYDFVGRTWEAFEIQGRWKCIRASSDAPFPRFANNSRRGSLQSQGDIMRDFEQVKLNDARLATLYRMMEMSDVGNFEYSPEGTLLRANSWYRLSLHPRAGETHTDFSFMNLVYPPDGPLVMSQWNKLTQGIPITFEMRWKSASYRGYEGGDPTEDAQWILSASLPIMDEAGKVISIAGNTIDINAQKRVQEQALQRAEALERAQASERKFSQFARLAPIAIFALDAQGRMTYCNDRFFELTGHDEVQDYKSIDWHLRIVFAGDYMQFEALWRTLLDDKKASHAHVRLQKTWDLGDGIERQMWAETRGLPELDAEGNLISIFGTLSDISQFKWAEDIQRIRIEEALEARQKQETFIDMTSHELRNPLSAVIQCADSAIESLQIVSSKLVEGQMIEIELQNLDAELKMAMDALNTIISCSLHQKQVVDDILTLSKLDAKLMTICPVLTEPAVLVSNAVHMFEVECRRSNINLHFLVDPSLRNAGARYVMMDPSRSLQVLINLITNAIKFTRDRPRRDIELSVGIATQRPEQMWNNITFAPVTTSGGSLLDNDGWGYGALVHVWIMCRDTGCGLSKEEQGNLFTRFSQATPRTHMRYGGSGLGLFISKRLAELHGGAIGVASVPNVGSTFAFFVSARIARSVLSPGTDDDLDSRPGAKHSRMVELSAARNNAYSVLIVEDNIVVNQKVLAQQLRKTGCTTHVANHGQEALDFLTKTNFWSQSPSDTREIVHINVVLMDMEMPVLDGVTCTRRIRALQASRRIIGHVPIIAVSANARSEQIAETREAGVDDVIVKPYRIMDLIPKIEALVKGEEPAVILTTSTGLA